MYNGWFCLGGTEIINNQRTVAYASTASQLENYSEPRILGEAGTLIATNLFTNPSFETASGTVEVRRNHATNPRFVGNTGWSLPATTGTWLGDGQVAIEATAAAGSLLPYESNARTAAPGEVWTVSRDFTVPVGYPAVRMNLAAAPYAGSGAVTSEFVYSPEVTIQPGQTVRISATTAALGATVTGMRGIPYLRESSVPAGTVRRLYMGRSMLEKSPISDTYFDGVTPPRIRENMSVNPRALNTNGWTSNNGVPYPVTRGVTPPVPHPMGIATAVESRNSGSTVNGVIASLYSIDGLINAGSPERMLGVWVLVTEPGYMATPGAGGATWPNQEIPANTWVWLQTITPFAAGSWATINIVKMVGNASSTVRAYLTGSLSMAGATPVGEYFDGATAPAPGTVNAWTGAFSASASYVNDTDFTAAWTGSANVSASTLSGAGVTGVGAGNSADVQSTRWAGRGQKSLRLVPTNLSNITSGIIADHSGSTSGTVLVAGRTYTVLAKRRLAAPLSGVLSSTYAGRAVLAQTGLSTLVSDALPNIAGEQELRWTFTVNPAATVVTLRLGHGGSQGSGDVWWDDVAVVEGNYTGPYFDGSFLPQEGLEVSWVGDEDASPSELMTPRTYDSWLHYCNINWFTGNDECGTMFDVLNDTWAFDANPVAWEARNIVEDAPWGSTSVYEDARKFMGVYALEVSELSDSTRSVDIVEGITDGGVLGRSRRSVPRFRFRVLLTALDMEGLEYGTAWLSKTLDEQACSSHGTSCGSTDLSFFVSCPPPPSVFIGSEGRSEPNAKYDLMIRTYHDVKCVEGPVVVQELVGKSENTYGRIVEFTLAAGVPNLFGKQDIQLGTVDTQFAGIITDVPRNSIPTPSAEVAGGPLVVATNYSTNPSVETNATGWAYGADGAQITSAMIAGARVVNELRAAGTASYRVVFTATGAGANGYLYAQQEVNISTRPAGSRVSVNMWAAEVLMSGTANRTPIQLIAYWRGTSGGAVLRTDVLGTIPVDGGALSVRSLLPPAGANYLLVRVQAPVTSWTAGTVLRLYADALTVSVP